MSRQYTPREATPSPADKPDVEPGQAPVAPDAAPEPAPVDPPEPETTEAAPAASEKSVAKAKKAPTHAQVARDKAAKERKAQDEAVLDGAPTFMVAYPTGISLHMPDEDEVEVTMSGGEKVWVDVIDEHAHIPAEGRIRARSVEQLTEFTRLAGQSILKQVLAS